MATTSEKITVATYVSAPVDKVWQYWTEPDHICKWNTATPEWHTTKAENDLRKGGRFSARMEAKDGSFGFDFGGVYDEVINHQQISYTMGDGRQVDVKFIPNGAVTLVEETFDPESTNSIDMQRDGWQAIMDNFKKYVEEKQLQG